MTKKEIATLSFRLLGIYAILQLIDKLAYIISYLIYGDLSGVKSLNFIAWAVPPALFLICGIFLWFTAPSFASSLFRKTELDDKLNGSLIDVQIVAFSVVGLFVLAESFPNFVRAAIWYFTVRSSEVSPLSGDLLAFLLRSTLGFWLLFGSRGIVGFIRKMRQEE